MLVSISILRGEVRESAGVTGIPQSWASHSHHSIGYTGVERAQGGVSCRCPTHVRGLIFLEVLPATPAHPGLTPPSRQGEPADPSTGCSCSDAVDRPKKREGHPSFSLIWCLNGSRLTMPSSCTKTGARLNAIPYCSFCFWVVPGSFNCAKFQRE